MPHEYPFHITAIGAIWFLWADFFAVIIVKYCVHKRYSYLYVLFFGFIGYVSSRILWLPLSIQAGMVGACFSYLWKMEKGINTIVCMSKKYATNVVILIVWIVTAYLGGRLWMANNFYEHIILNYISAVSGSYCIITFCKWLTDKLKYVNLLLFFGKNSLYILCVHLFELNIAPWMKAADLLMSLSISRFAINLLFFVIKLIWAIIAVNIILYLKESRIGKDLFT